MQDKFEEVDWESAHGALHSVLHLFQVWASKHVLGIAGTMRFLAHQDGQELTCPSCRSCKETCAHILRCPEAGCTEAFLQSVQELSRWIKENEMHPDLVSVILEYAQRRSEIACIKCTGELQSIVQEFTTSQDRIGWENFMVRMVSTKLLCIQDSYLWVRGLFRIPHNAPRQALRRCCMPQRVGEGPAARLKPKSTT